ncbi:MAG: carbohydrate kinase family protein [Dehalococcoidia bacterium]|nr:MAG: carbohydrate kinase family protein [Dehalococcoidia bacterium]
MPNLDVIGLGVLRSDHIYSIEKGPVHFEQLARLTAVTSGGAAANTIFGLTKLGLKCGIIGAVGNDPPGRDLVAELMTAGIDTSNVATINTSPTDSAIFMNGDDGARVNYLCHGAGMSWGIDDAMLSALKQTAIVHIGGLTGLEQLNAIDNVLDLLPPAVRISLSISDSEAVMGFKTFEPLISRASIIFASKTAIESLTGKNYQRSIRMCRKIGAQTMAIFLSCGEENKKIRKKGKAASITTYICNHEYECMIESAIRKWPNVVEVTGAQDAFAAGFLYGLFKGKPIDECGFLGDILAQACLKKPGARDSLPDAQELSARYFQIHREELMI